MDPHLKDPQWRIGLSMPLAGILGYWRSCAFLGFEVSLSICKLSPLICKLDPFHLCLFHPLNILNLLILVYICFSLPLLVSLPFFTSLGPLSVLGTQALERQKDFFDSIRSERDDLRDEVVVLKEQLKVCKRNKRNLYSSADPFPPCMFRQQFMSSSVAITQFSCCL